MMKNLFVNLINSKETLLGSLCFIGLYMVSLYSFPLFHGLAELFSIVIGCGIFIVAWNSRRFLGNDYLLFIGLAYLFVSFIDMIHTLAYKGMGVFQGYDANLPTQLWIIARYIESVSLLIAPLFFRKKLKPGFVLAGYSFAILLVFLSIFYWNIFPVCFVEGKGLTPFKIISEYLISTILLASIALLVHYRNEFDKEIFRLMIWSIITTLLSELAFTFYVSVYGLSNLIGHLLKIVSFFLIYKAIIKTGIVKPYDLIFRKLKQSEETLRSERDFAEGLIETAQAIVLVLDTQGRIVRFNPYMEEISGYRLEEVKGKDWFSTFLPERDRDRIRQLFIKATGNIQTRGNINPIVTKFGHEIEVEWYDKILKDAEGRTFGLLSIGQEITERKRAEEALQESRERYRTLFGNVPIGLYRTTGDGQIIDANPAMVEMLGYPDHASLLTINAADTYVDPEARTERQNILKDKRFLKDYDMRLRRLDGSVLWVEDNVRVIYHADGRILYYEGTLRDITERKKLEEVLKVSTRQWQTTFEGINDAICLLDMEGKILQCNKTMATLLGKSFSEIIGSICCKLVHGTSGPIEGCPRIRMRETRSRENLVLSLEDRWFNVSSDPILDETDHLIGTVHIISDITERKRAEEEREKLIRELQEALAKIKKLSGFLPICASCKKIRDDKGYWNQIESYLLEHSEAEFTHSLCPECMKKLYPDFADSEE